MMASPLNVPILHHLRIVSSLKPSSGATSRTVSQPAGARLVRACPRIVSVAVTCPDPDPDFAIVPSPPMLVTSLSILARYTHHHQLTPTIVKDFTRL